MRLLALLLFLFNTLYANAQVIADAGADVSICMKDTVKLVGKGLNPADTGTYQWREITLNKIVSSTAFLTFKTTDTITKYFELKVTRTSIGVTYTDLDTLKLTTLALPTFSYKGMPSRCFSDGSVDISNIVIAKNSNGAKGEVRFWQNRIPSWLSGNNGKIWCPIILNSQIPNGGLKDTIFYDYSDDNGCYNSGSYAIKLNANPIVKVNDGIFCQRDGWVSLDKLVALPVSKISGLQTWRCIAVPQGSGVDPDSIIAEDNSIIPTTYWIDIGQEDEKQKTGVYLVEYCFKNPSSNCQTCDTAKVIAVRMPEFEFDTMRTICSNAITVLDSFVYLKGNQNKYIGGQWQCVAFNESRNQTDSNVKHAVQSSVINHEYFRPFKKGNYTLKIVDLTSGCYSADSVSFIVNPSPEVQINLPDSVCSDEKVLPLVSNYGNDTNGLWMGDFIQANHFYPAQAFVSGDTFLMINYLYTDPTTMCSGKDSAAIAIVRSPEIDFNCSKQQGSDSIYNFSLNVPFLDSSEFFVRWDFGNGTTSTNKHPANIGYSLNDSFDISCIVVNQQGCADTLVKKLVVKVSSKVLKNELLHRVKIFPNPSNGKISINFCGDFNLMVTDITGKIIITSENLQEVYLSKGVYFFKITINDSVFIEKIIVW